MIIDTKYKVLVNNEINVFITTLTENAFLSTLDSIYGVGNYSILEIEKIF